MEGEKIDGKIKMLMEYMETRFNQIDEKFEKIDVRFVDNEIGNSPFIGLITSNLDKLDDLLDFADKEMADLEHEIRQLSMTFDKK